MGLDECDQVLSHVYCSGIINMQNTQIYKDQSREKRRPHNKVGKIKPVQGKHQNSEDILFSGKLERISMQIHVKYVQCHTVEASPKCTEQINVNKVFKIND